MDFVEEVLRFLTARMQIEAEWAVQERTSFTWWAHTLAQRVWVAEPREFQGVQLTTLHIETDVLADVPMDAATWTRLAAVNQYATLSAYVADTAQGTIRLHSSVSLTADNFLLAQSIALHAMALQMADAYAEAAELAAAFGGTVAATPHPASRPAGAARRDGRHPRGLPATRRGRFAVRRRRDRAAGPPRPASLDDGGQSRSIGWMPIWSLRPICMRVSSWMRRNGTRRSAADCKCGCCCPWNPMMRSRRS